MLSGTQPDVIEALRATPAALSAFEALPPSHRAEYLSWIGGAKKADTRARRIHGMIEKLTVGTGVLKAVGRRPERRAS